MDQPIGNSAGHTGGSIVEQGEDDRWSVPKNRGFEIKFAIPRHQISQVLDFARARLALDPHVSPNSGTYHVSSLYCDTPDWAVFRRQPGYARSKHRIRRYQAEATVFLEVKLRRGSRVAKRRVTADLSQLSSLQTHRAEEQWAGAWFLRGLSHRGLGPSLFVEYERAAFEGEEAGCPVRLTLDTALFAAPACEYNMRHSGTVPILPQEAILELKYHTRVPELFRGLVERLALHPAAISKYRMGVAAAGLAAATAPAISLDDPGDTRWSGLRG